MFKGSLVFKHAVGVIKRIIRLRFVNGKVLELDTQPAKIRVLHRELPQGIKFVYELLGRGP